VTHFFVFMLLTLSNYIYQMLQNNPDYSVAFERSYFQGAAVLVVFFITQSKA